MCGKVTKESKGDDENKIWPSGCFEMERDTVGQEHYRVQSCVGGSLFPKVSRTCRCF